MGSPNGTSSGFGTSDVIRGTGGNVIVDGGSYTASAGDFGATPQSNYSTNCIWPGSGTVAAGDVYQTVWSNGSGPAITNSYASSTYYTTSSQNVTGTYASGSTSFTVPNPAPEVLNIMPTATIANLQVGDVVAPSLKVVKQGTSLDLLEPCVRDEALPAPTVTANSSASSVTVSLTVPTSSTHYSGWLMVQVFACDTTITACGGRSSNGRIDASFGYMGSINANATSVTFDAQHTISYSFTMGQTMPRWDPTVSYKYVAVYMPNQGVNYQGFTAASASIAATVPSNPSPSSTPASPSSTSTTTLPEAKKPLPVWAAPILKQIPTLSKTLNTDGGKVSLTDGDFSSLKSVTVGGQAVTYSTDAKGDVNIPIPAGKAGTTADLVVTFTGGKMTIQDGIKYVAPTDVSAVREAPIAGFAKNSTKINGVLAETIQYAAQLDKKANTVLCTGYAPSKAAVATVTAQATAACGYATKVNDQLVNKTVKVVVNAKLAKTAPVGIKVYH